MDNKDLEDQLKDWAYEQLIDRATNTVSKIPASPYLSQLSQLAGFNSYTDDFMKDYLWSMATQGMTEDEIYNWICQMFLEESQ